MSNKQKYIHVKGAKLHNLKNIEVKIPHNKLTVITGLSGSGKSSLAFDTIYAEGQRRFVESLSAYARQFLERMVKPEVDFITGIPPALAIEQKPPSRNPRSTVGTTTEVYDYLRLLFGRIGKTYCKDCGKEVRKDTPDLVVEEIFNFMEGTKLYILFQIDESDDLTSEINKIKSSGFFRMFDKKTKELVDLEDIKLTKTNIENYLILVDRLKLSKSQEEKSRITESLEQAFNFGKNKLTIYDLDKNKYFKYSKDYDCSDCDILYFEPEPRLFSFNNPFGACPHCQGFGRTIGIDENLVVPDKSKSIKRGAILPFSTEIGSKHLRALIQIASKYNIPIDEPYNHLDENQQKLVWEGKGNYKGIDGFFKMLEDKSYKMHYRVLLSRYRGYTICKICGGSRIRTSARQVYIQDMNIPKLIDLPLDKVQHYVNSLKLTEHEINIADSILMELKWRIGLLVDIGLEYLTLARLTHTLSGGEGQRINLSTALGYSLVGTLYVLDEPSIGLHSRDTNRLLKILYKLRNLGNTIIVVEHDPDIILQADNIIDVGPKAGEHGGEIQFQGTVDELKKSKKSLTSQYLSGKKNLIPIKNKNKKWDKSLVVKTPKKHNLDIEQVEIPLNCMTVVTGVSGSGKSTLIKTVLFEYLNKFYSGFGGTVGAFEDIKGLNHVDAVEMVDQSPIGKSSRSTPATYTKAFDAIRELYSNTQASKQMGWKPGYFSFNVSGGRCETCEGEGTVSIDMQFLPDVSLVCEDCGGTRYKKETRKILHNGKSIVDVLNMTIDEAIEFFTGHRKVTRKLEILQKVGLGYLRLGQPSNLLSGGESQRVKLASHLDSKNTERKLFIFDEPTTGLHLHDIVRLINCFNELITNGHSVLIIEHNLQVISTADWIIDLGPEAGENGGKIVAEGTPKQIIKMQNSHTGRALNDYLHNFYN